MKPEIIKHDIDWVDVKNSCRTTIGKDATSNVPDKIFRRKLMISEHSPIRLLTIEWLWKDLKSWVATHFVRHHVGITPFVQSQRTDRTGVPRDELPQGALVDMRMTGNAQALIDMCRKRLCFQASPETRECAEDLKMTITDEVDDIIGDALVPNCVYRGGCPEFTMCKEQFWVKFCAFCAVNNLSIDTIQKRYDAYNKYFAQTHKRNFYKGEKADN